MNYLNDRLLLYAVLTKLVGLELAFVVVELHASCWTDVIKSRLPVEVALDLRLFFVLR